MQGPLEPGQHHLEIFSLTVWGRRRSKLLSACRSSAHSRAPPILLPPAGPAHSELGTAHLPILRMEKQALGVEVSC